MHPEDRVIDLDKSDRHIVHGDFVEDNPTRPLSELMREIRNVFDNSDHRLHEGDIVYLGGNNEVLSVDDRGSAHAFGIITSMGDSNSCQAAILDSNLQQSVEEIKKNEKEKFDKEFKELVAKTKKNFSNAITGLDF